MKSDNIVKKKSTDFAVRIMKMVRFLVKEIPFAEHPICTQLLKSGTSIGANVREAEHAESTDDFVHKLKVALKEANETEYWLDLLNESNIISHNEYSIMKSSLNEIISMLVSSIKTLKERNN